MLNKRTLFLLGWMFAALLPAASAAEEGAPAGVPLTLDGITLNGRFDLYYQWTGFSDSWPDAQDSFENYHHFVFINRKSANDPFFFTAELVDLTFYEGGLKFGDRFRYRFGKILVPFGADPLFHHSYGGLSGVDQRLLPTVWAERGAALSAVIYEKGSWRVDADLYTVAGISGKDDEVLALNLPGNKDTTALGGRVRAGYDKYTLWASAYHDDYTKGQDLWITGLDAAAAYGFLPWPVLENFALKLGGIRADVSSEALGHYFHFADYLQVDYRLPASFKLRYRTGALTWENHRDLVFDLSKEDVKDTVSHTFSAYWRYQLLTLGIDYIINLEAEDEINNDVLRLSSVIEF
jgi:hypothetical protein